MHNEIKNQNEKTWKIVVGVLLLVFAMPIGIIFIWSAKIFHKKSRVIVSCICAPIIFCQSILWGGCILSDKSLTEISDESVIKRNEEAREADKNNYDNSKSSEGDSKISTSASTQKTPTLLFADDKAQQNFEIVKDLDTNTRYIIDLVNEGSKCYSDADGVDISELQIIANSIEDYHTKVENEYIKLYDNCSEQELDAYNDYLESCKTTADYGYTIIDSYVIEYNQGLSDEEYASLQIYENDYGQAIIDYNDISEKVIQKLKNNGIVKK